MEIPKNFNKLSDFYPQHKREVKLLVSCYKLSYLITTTGWLLNHDQNRWYIEGYDGPCYKVIAWAELDAKTPNFSTETL